MFLYSTYFVQENQKKVIGEILGVDTVPKYIDSNKFLAKGHLCPDADMLMASWKLPTYFYINVAPQWQRINSGNWQKVEASVRTLASRVSTLNKK